MRGSPEEESPKPPQPVHSKSCETCIWRHLMVTRRPNINAIIIDHHVSLQRTSNESLPCLQANISSFSTTVLPLRNICKCCVFFSPRFLSITVNCKLKLLKPQVFIITLFCQYHILIIMPKILNLTIYIK